MCQNNRKNGSEKTAANYKMYQKKKEVICFTHKICYFNAFQQDHGHPKNKYIFGNVQELKLLGLFILIMYKIYFVN